MSRPRVDWNKAFFEIDFNMIDEVFNNDFREKIYALLGEVDDEVIRLLSCATFRFADTANNENKKNHENLAAQILAKDSELLAKKLSNGCGGLELRLNSQGFDTKQLSHQLTQLASFCNEYSRKDNFSVHQTIRQSRIELAKWIQFTLEEKLSMKTSTYVGEENMGIFGKVFSVCVEAAVGVVPTSIKQDIIEAKKEPLSELDFDLCEIDLEEIMQETLKKI